MKTVRLALFFVSINFLQSVAHSQEEKKNEFRIEYFSPVTTPGMGQFLDKSVQVSSPDYSRKYFSGGLSATYSRKINNIKIGYRFGIGYKKITDRDKYNSDIDGYGNNKYDYTQSQYYNSVYISREEQIKKLLLHFTIELPFIIYGPAKMNAYTRSYLNQGGTLSWENIAEEKRKIGSGIATGLGLNIGVSYCLSKSVNIGADLCDYLLYSSFHKKTDVNYHSYQYDASTPPPGISETTNSYSLKKNINQVEFSSLSPRIFCAFKF